MTVVEPMELTTEQTLLPLRWGCDVMNCSKCSAPIDYRFSTVCPHCSTELPITQLASDDETPLTLHDRPSAVLPSKRRLSLKQHFGNAVLVLMCSFASTVVGASTLFFIGGIIYRILSTPEPHSCGQGMAIAYLLILTGGFLGCTGGTVFGYRHTMSVNSG